VNIRLLAALRANKRSHIVEAIRGRRDCGSHYDRGNCLRILGRWFLQQGSFPRALGFFQAALREYTQDDAMDARLKELAIRGTLGSMAFYDGRFTDAKALLSRAIREAAALRHPFYEYSFRLEIAKLHILNGEPARSREVLEDSLDRLAQRRNTAPIDLFLHIGLLIWAGEAALEMEDSRHAREYARRASVLLQQEDHSRLRANLHVLRARIKSSGRRPLWNEALAELAEAERLHRSIGDGDRLWIHARVALERAKLHVHRRDLRAALASAVECMEMAQATQFVPMQARSLLLQSQLLLQQEMPGADRLYEEVLRSLGAVKDPVILFKVIANLYFYTWHLEGNLDLTDCHLKQIHKMAQVLDRKTFDELYERHVCRRVARRFFAHAFGGDRAAPGNWAADEP
jgi:tetratricopeptide (TPR) repeat protein